jgi:DNA-binding transcriptional LysR family regulator
MDSLSRIGIFITVARLESFAGAARELGLTPSAISKQVLNLESELRIKLLNRTTRKVSASSTLLGVNSLWCMVPSTKK